MMEGPPLSGRSPLLVIFFVKYLRPLRDDMEPVELVLYITDMKGL